MRDVDMSPQAVTRRLEEASDLHAEQRLQRKPIDMSPMAVTRRIRKVSELRALCVALGRRPR